MCNFSLFWVSLAFEAQKFEPCIVLKPQFSTCVYNFEFVIKFSDFVNADKTTMTMATMSVEELWRQICSSFNIWREGEFLFIHHMWPTKQTSVPDYCKSNSPDLLTEEWTQHVLCSENLMSVYFSGFFLSSHEVNENVKWIEEISEGDQSRKVEVAGTPL